MLFLPDWWIRAECQGTYLSWKLLTNTILLKFFREPVLESSYMKHFLGTVWSSMVSYDIDVDFLSFFRNQMPAWMLELISFR